jgi:hypothetical protein
MQIFRISAARVAAVLVACVSVLVAASTFGQFSTYYLGHAHLFGLVNLLSLDREANIPSWYASTTLLLCSALLGFIAMARRTGSDRRWRYWAGLSAIFLLLSIDEAASIHELSIEPLQQQLGLGGFFHWAWVIPGMLFVAVLGVVYLRFMLSLPRQTRVLFVLAAAAFVGGALGVEMLGAAWFTEHGRRNMGYSLYWTAEETLEMIGVVIFIYALLRYVEKEIGYVRIGVGAREPEAPVGKPDASAWNVELTAP